MAKETLQLVLPPGSLGLKKIKGGVKSWVGLFKGMSDESIPRKLVVLRDGSGTATNSGSVASEQKGAPAPTKKDGASRKTSKSKKSDNDNTVADKSTSDKPSSKGAKGSGSVANDGAAKASPAKPSSEGAKENESKHHVIADGHSMTLTAKQIEEFKAVGVEVAKDLSRPQNAAELAESKKAGYVSPLDITALDERFPRAMNVKKYRYTFREFVHLSDRQKGILEAMNDPVPEGYCTKIMDADFDQLLAPLTGTGNKSVPFQNDSDINRWGVFIWNMFDACETGSIGGDACRMNAVLIAAAEDTLAIPDYTERIHHLLGLCNAIRMHGLRAFFERGDEESAKAVFEELAKQWKKFFEPDRAHQYNVSDGVRDFAKMACQDLQQLLRKTRELYGDWAMKPLNFNYIRIPRPKRKKEAQLAKENSANGEEEGSAKKKKKKVSPMEKMMEKINAVEGVPEDVAVYDSCETVREKLRAFLQRDGVTKKNLCAALGNINNNSLNRFLDATGQKQKGNCTYRNAYIFFEKLRIMEGCPKTDERLTYEHRWPEGYDTEKSKGGRPETVYYFRAM